MGRMKRTCKPLVSMVTVFLFCWLPLSLFNLAFQYIMATVTDKNTFFTLFGTCHLLGMTSACTNPVLYGFLNESFKKEFKEMLSHLNVRQKCVMGSQEEPVAAHNGAEPHSKAQSLPKKESNPKAESNPEVQSNPKTESQALLRSQPAMGKYAATSAQKT